MLTPAELRVRLEDCAAHVETALAESKVRYAEYIVIYPRPFTSETAYMGHQIYIDLAGIYAAIANLKDS